MTATEEKGKHVRPSWDEYFLQMIDMIGSRGTCDRGRAGCIITLNNRIISTGYVGAPAGLPSCDDIGHEMHMVTHEDGTTSRHCIRTAHAEQNAINNAARIGIAIEGGTLYCKMTPCYKCAQSIINSGIVKVVALKDYHGGGRSKEIFDQVGIKYEVLGEMETYKDM